MKGSLRGQRQKNPSGTDTRTEPGPPRAPFGDERIPTARADARTEPFRTASARRCGARRDSRRASGPFGAAGGGSRSRARSGAAALGSARHTEALCRVGARISAAAGSGDGTERSGGPRSARDAELRTASGAEPAGSPDIGTVLSPARSGRNRSGARGQRRGCAGRWEAAAAADARRNGAPCDATSGATAGIGTGTEHGRDPLSALAQRPTSKKRRKSRTAFSNQQLFELERRFVRQKYLSPADRDQLAQRLALSSAQVITWFQNRRAKLKRDLDEMRADVASLQALRLREPPPAPPGPAELSEEEIDVGA